MRSAGLILVTMFALGATGCMDVERDDPSVIPDDQMRMAVRNNTDRALGLFVNGQDLGAVAPDSGRTLDAVQLPALPWDAELRLPSGRTVVKLTIHSGSIRRTETSASGVFARQDLSCGRVEIWSGSPPGGPPHGPGNPGDCD